MVGGGSRGVTAGAGALPSLSPPCPWPPSEASGAQKAQAGPHVQAPGGI